MGSVVSQLNQHSKKRRALRQLRKNMRHVQKFNVKNLTGRIPPRCPMVVMKEMGKELRRLYPDGSNWWGVILYEPHFVTKAAWRRLEVRLDRGNELINIINMPHKDVKSDWLNWWRKMYVSDIMFIKSTSHFDVQFVIVVNCCLRYFALHGIRSRL